MLKTWALIFRSAALFGVDCIITPVRRSASVENEFTIKAASGAMSIVPVCKVANIRESITLLKKHNIWTYALDMKGKNIFTYSMPQRIAFVLGNEHAGVHSLTLRECDETLSIPMCSTPTIDSLNVSVSSGIVCYEYNRQYPLHNSKVEI